MDSLPFNSFFSSLAYKIFHLLFKLLRIYNSKINLNRDTFKKDNNKILKPKLTSKKISILYLQILNIEINNERKSHKTK